MAIDLKRFQALEQNVTGNTASVHEAGKTLLGGLEEILREAHESRSWHEMGKVIELLGERKSALAAGLQVGLRGQFGDTEATIARPADVRDERSARDLSHDPESGTADDAAEREFRRGAEADANKPTAADQYKPDASAQT
jgi:hypothetical protein